MQLRTGSGSRLLSDKVNEKTATSDTMEVAV